MTFANKVRLLPAGVTPLGKAIQLPKANVRLVLFPVCFV